MVASSDDVRDVAVVHVGRVECPGLRRHDAGAIWLSHSRVLQLILDPLRTFRPDAALDIVNGNKLLAVLRVAL